jgi:hypothetical protein
MVRLQEIKEARAKEHQNPLHVIYPRPVDWWYDGWVFSEKRFEKMNLSGGQMNFYKPKGQIINRLLESQGMKREKLLHGRFKLFFSSEVLPDYQVKLHLSNRTQKWVNYHIIEGPKEVLNLGSDRLNWDVRAKTILAFFPIVPKSIYAKAEPLLDLEEVENLSLE